MSYVETLRRISQKSLVIGGGFLVMGLVSGCGKDAAADTSGVTTATIRPPGCPTLEREPGDDFLIMTSRFMPISGTQAELACLLSTNTINVYLARKPDTTSYAYAISYFSTKTQTLVEGNYRPQPLPGDILTLEQQLPDQVLGRVRVDIKLCGDGTPQLCYRLEYRLHHPNQIDAHAPHPRFNQSLLADRQNPSRLRRFPVQAHRRGAQV